MQLDPQARDWQYMPDNSLFDIILSIAPMPEEHLIYMIFGADTFWKTFITYIYIFFFFTFGSFIETGIFEHQNNSTVVVRVLGYCLKRPRFETNRHL
jgi:hypothetical protein